MTFKPSSDDIRTSISLDLKKANQNGLRSVFSRSLDQSEVDFKLFTYKEVATKTNNVLISTNHKNFENMDFGNKNVIFAGKN